MNDPNDEIATLLAKEMKLTQDDLDQIEVLLCLGDPDTAFERRGYVMEGVALIVNDPLYRGDIAPIE